MDSPSSTPQPIVKVFGDQGCQSYLVGCPLRREAILVDPKFGRQKTYRDHLERYGLRLIGALDTHTHADHLSATSLLLRAGLPVWMSRKTPSARRVTRLADGDPLAVGELRFTTIEVPGHTPDSIALYGHGMALVGDTLFAGALARSDFRGSDAAQLFDSIRTRLLPLPPETVVFSGHAYLDLLFSTIGHEAATNPALRYAGGADYAAATGDVPGRGNTPDVDLMLATNLAEDPTLPEGPVQATACCAASAAPEARIRTPREIEVQEAAQAQDEWARSGRWVDVRDPWEVAGGAIPGTRNLPLGELGFHLRELAGEVPLLLSCLGGVRSLTAAKTLSYLGVARDPLSLKGGYRAWVDAGKPIVPATPATPAN